ncbi:MAG: hypothetical protein U0Q07_13525 [Acidimicrobiales bacterium]
MPLSSRTRRITSGAVALTALGGLAVAGVASIAEPSTAAAATTLVRPHGPAPGAVLDRIWKRSADVAGRAIGISADQLRSEARGGPTVEEVARRHGADPAAVQRALVAAADEGIADAVRAGDLTDAEAAVLRSRVEQLADRYLHAPTHGPAAPGTTAAVPGTTAAVPGTTAAVPGTTAAVPGTTAAPPSSTSGSSTSTTATSTPSPPGSTAPSSSVLRPSAPGTSAPAPTSVPGPSQP